MEGLKPHVSDKSEESDDGKGPQHEHETPHHEELPHSDVDSSVDDDEVKKEVDEAIKQGQEEKGEYGIDDADLQKKIEATVEFFLGKLPARSEELISALQTRRGELSTIITNTREGLSKALTTEFEQAWNVLHDFLEQLTNALEQRDEAALGATGEAVAEFASKVNDLRENVMYSIKDLQAKLQHADPDTQHQVNQLIYAEKARFEAGIEEYLTAMETVVGDMQASQDKAFDDARAALAAGFSSQRTTFYNSLTRDAAAFNDSLNNNYNAFVESLNAQRAAFNNSLAEK